MENISFLLSEIFNLDFGLELGTIHVSILDTDEEATLYKVEKEGTLKTVCLQYHDDPNSIFKPDDWLMNKYPQNLQQLDMINWVYWHYSHDAGEIDDVKVYTFILNGKPRLFM